MKKTLILIFILIGLFTTCYSIPAFIQNNRVELTPEQKAAFEQKVRDRPDSLTYNPMHVGDKWWFESSHGTTDIKRRILDSLLVNDTLYFQGYGIASYWWLRNRGDSTLVRDISDFDDNPNTIELVNEDFTIQTHFPDVSDWVYNGYGEMPNVYSCSLGEEGFITIFGITTHYREYIYNYVQGGDLFHGMVWARGFGNIAFYNEWETCSLAGAIINGISYGTTPVVDDVNLSPKPDIQVKIYPNPFKTNAKIDITFPESINSGLIEVYDIKGRLINQISASISGDFTWDGKNRIGNRVPPGVYLVRVSSLNFKTTQKVLLIN